MVLTDISIADNVKQFIEGVGTNKGRHPKERYSSFDYCYNYFQEFRETKRISDLCSSENLQISCLQLAFYLASWGMLRGSTFLLEKSSKYLEDTITLISQFDENIWLIDVDKYDDENIDLLLKFKDELACALDTGRKPSDVLLSKIMLGVFANTPAFDDFFGTGFGLRTFNRKSLRVLSGYYSEHKSEIDGYNIHTIDFLSGQDTSRLYSRAKIIDMVGFIEGQEIRAAQRKAKDDEKT